MTIHDSLTKYGSSFQIKCVATLIREQSLLAQVSDIVETSFFDSDSLQWIVRTLLIYWHSFKQIPTLDVFGVEATKLDSYKDMGLISSIKRDLAAVYDALDAADLEYVKTSFLSFCKNQAMKRAIMRSADYFLSGEEVDFSQIKGIIDNALHVGETQKPTYDWKENLTDRLTEIQRNTVSLPWDSLNDLTEGGAGAGELFVFVAPSGVGKTWALAKIGLHALKMGHNVLHYTLELSERYTASRYDFLATGIKQKHAFLYKDEMEAKLAEYNGDLKISYYPTNTATVNTIRADVARHQALGFIPDIILVDYADLLRAGEKTNSMYENGGVIYKELRGLAGELGLPIFTASQTQRTAINEEIIGADKIAESFQKIMISDFVASISRRQEDRSKNEGKMYVMKNRFGKDSVIFDMKIDLEQGIMDIIGDESTVPDATYREADALKRLMNKAGVSV